MVFRRTLAAAALGVSIPAYAQQPTPVERVSAGQHATLLTTNALLSGLTSGLTQVFRGGSFARGFAYGTVGGSIVYGGKRLSAQTFDGAGFLGRQVTSLGSSVAANGAAGRGMFDRMMLSLGPLPGRLVISPSESFKVRPVIDLVSTTALVYGLIASDEKLDLGESLSSGAAIFRNRELPVGGIVNRRSSTGSIPGATAVGGVIFVDDAVTDPTAILAHERVHVVQFDHIQSLWGDEFDSFLLNHRPAGQYLKMNALPMLGGLLGQIMVAPDNRENLPWEVEARWLSGQ